MFGLADLTAALLNGENSGVEFKRDDIKPFDLAREMCAFANLRGGIVLLGVEDDGTVSGLTKTDVDEWAVTIARDKLRPPIIPFVETITDPASGRQVAVISVEPGFAVHAVWHNSHFSYYLRAGRQTREASPEELGRLQQQRGAFRAELRPVGSVPLDGLDLRRLDYYFGTIRDQAVPGAEDVSAWTRLLLATEILIDGVSEPVATVAGLVLFGRTGGRALPHSAIDCVAYPGPEKGYDSIDRATLRGPLTPLLDASGNILERGLIDSALDFLTRVAPPTARVEGGRRIDRPSLPSEVVREIIVNAAIHRDYMLAHTDIQVELFSDRLEVTSPGRLPNGITLEGMRLGARAARNEVMKDVMRDFGYLEHMGLGIPRKVIAGMNAFNGTDPDFRLGEESVTVVIWR